MAKKKVLSLWKAIMLVVTGMVGILGVTALVLYLTGQLDEKHVEPNHMSFSEVVEGEAFFDGYTTIAEVNGQVAVFKTSTDFQMTISSQTEGVTETEVTLSLSNQISSKNGVLTDGVIIVPEKVELNKAFTVKLSLDTNSELVGEVVENWVRGGSSVIMAQSSANILLEPIYAQVMVDVPVYDFSASVAGQEAGQEVNSVFVGTSFAVDAKFLPSQSKKLFSEGGTSKVVFYSFTKAFIDYDWEYERFVANKKSGADSDTITVYTFKNSYYQQKILSQFSSQLSYQELTTRILEYANQRDPGGELVHENEFVTTEIKVKVTDVEIGSISISADGKTFSPYCNQYYTLTANSSLNGDANMEAVIKDGDGTTINSALSNMALRFPTLPQGVTVGDIQMVGGAVIKVLKQQDGTLLITQESFAESKYASGKYFVNSEVVDGKSCNVAYYLLPNTTPTNPGNYYWQFACSREFGSLQFDINFFYENDLGRLENFFLIEGFNDLTGASSEKIEKSFTMTPQERDYEENPSWTGDSIYLTINYDSNGKAIESSKELYKELNAINKDNVYSVVKYFLFVDEKAAVKDSEEILKSFNVKAGKVYTEDYLGQTLKIDGSTATVGENGYRLYELDGITEGVLTARKSYSYSNDEDVCVVVATIQTYADDKPILESDGRYKIVKTSRVRAVVVDSTLSIANMTASFTLSSEVSANAAGEYYIKAINRNQADRSPKAMVDLVISLKEAASANAGKDTDKLLAAEGLKKLSVICVDSSGNKTQQYLKLQSLLFDRIEDGVAFYKGSLMIDEQLFKADPNFLDDGTRIALKLQYDDGNKVHSTDIVNGKEGATKNHFYIYNQQPNELVWNANEKEKLVDENGKYVIDANLTADGKIEIEWGASSIAAAANPLQALNDALSFKIKDQQGNEIDPGLGLYTVKLVETPPTGQSALIALNGNQQQITGFNSTNGDLKKTTLQAFIVDANDEKVYKYDGFGNVDKGENQDNFNASVVFDFNIQSEGVSHVLYNTSTEIKAGYVDNTLATADGVVDVENDDYTLGKTGYGSVAMYAIPDAEIDMSTLLKVYVNNQASANLSIYLDRDFVLGLSAERQTDILKMIAIKTDGAAAAAEVQTKTLKDYEGVKIKYIHITNAFKEDTDLRFVVKDANEMLFEIELTLTLKSDLRIDNAFNTYNEEYGDYLVSQDGAIGVFADETYQLSDYLALTSMTGSYRYDWKTAIGVYQDLSPYIEELTGKCTLTKDGSGNIMLDIAPVYRLTKVNVTIYFGSKSLYACRASFSLCLNPNVVLEENVSDINALPYINLQNSAAWKLESNYNFYKFTDYIKGVRTEVAPAGGIFKYVNTTSSDDRYVEINQDGTISFIPTTDADGDEIAKTIRLGLGGKIAQNFQVQLSALDGSSTENVQVLKIKTDGTNSKTELCGVSGAVTLSFNIGYGQENATDLAGSVLQRIVDEANGDYVAVPTTTYKDEVYVVIVQGESYKINNAFTLSHYEGALTTLVGNLYANEISSFISYKGNSFVVNTTLTAGDGETTVDVEVSIKAIVSKLGERFVYYQPFNIKDGEKVYDVGATPVFNTYSNVQLQDLIGDYATHGESAYVELEENDVYQTLEAGEIYKLVHFYDINDAAVSSQFGFYVLERLVREGVDASSLNVDINLSIVEEAKGYIKGLAEIDAFADPTEEKQGFCPRIKINHLEQAYENAYIVLRLEVADWQNTSERFVWFYRIKVAPSFALGAVKYPYAEDAEYLDRNSSQYYKFDEEGQRYYYEVALEETLDQSNSKWAAETRFPVCKNVDGISDFDGATKLTYVYSVSSADGDGEYEFVSDDRRGKLLRVYLESPSTKYTLCVVRTVEADGNLMIGSASEYTFKFNQGDSYSVAILQKELEAAGDPKPLSDTSGNKVFASAIKAGENETTYTISIDKTQGGVSVGVESLIAKFVDEKNLANALLARMFAKKGAKIYSDNAGTEAGRTLEEELPIVDNVDTTAVDESAWQEASSVSGYYPILIGETTYFVAADDVSWGYAILREEGDYFYLDIKPKASIAQDKNYRIEFYTEQRPAFYIDLSVESYFARTQGLTEVDGGKTYGLLSTLNGQTITEQGIFDEIKSAAGTDISSFAVTLKKDKNLNGIIDSTEGSADEIKDIVVEYGNTTLTYADLIEIVNAKADGSDVEGSAWQNSTISFANLKCDVEFEFVGTINDGSGVEYTFEFTILAKKSFEEKARTVTDTENRFGGVAFSFEWGGIDDNFADLIFENNKTSYKIVKCGDQAVDGTVAITPENVASTTTQNVILTVECYFGGKAVLEFEVGYVYTVLKNVEPVANYPMADGETMSAVEYIGTNPAGVGAAYKYVSESHQKFFTSPSLNNTANRIGIKTSEGASFSEWNVSVSKITNAVLIVEAPSEKEITSSGAEVFRGSEIDGVTLRFGLINDASNGEIEFTVLVNKVPTTYTVVIVAGSVYTVKTNAPNYANNKEQIYAEEYVLLEEGEIFADGRILNYAFKSTASKSAAYFARFEKGGESQVIEIDSSVLGQVVNKDLGHDNFAGFKYAGTFFDKAAAEQNKVDKKYVDADVFESAPRLTGRVEATYYDGTSLNLNKSTYILMTLQDADGNDVGGAVEAKTVKLAASDSGKTKTYKISINIGTAKHDTTSTYSVAFDIMFEMEGGVESSASYSIIELEANPNAPTNLLSLANTNGIRLINPVTGELYTADSLFSSAGQISLKIYGFEDLPIYTTKDSGSEYYNTAYYSSIEEQRLSDIAYDIHQQLSSSSENGIKYSTGLTPRKYDGFALNGALSTGTTKNNYISITGIPGQDNKKIVDFNIFAQGANNDGNHVMMRLTYSVDVDGTPIEKHYNLLFKVLPNSTISFRNKLNEVGSTTAGSEILDFATVASNHESPFEIDLSSGINYKDNDKIYFWNEDANQTTYDQAVVTAYMYGNKADNVNKQFTYDNAVNLSDNETITVTGNQHLTYPEVQMGEKNYVVEMENSFGYKGRFYFRVYSKINPTIVSGATTLIEGETFAFASTYQNVVVTGSEDGSEEIVFDYNNNDEEKGAGVLASIAVENVKSLTITVDLDEKKTVGGVAGVQRLILGTKTEHENSDVVADNIEFASSTTGTINLDLLSPNFDEKMALGWKSKAVQAGDSNNAVLEPEGSDLTNAKFTIKVEVDPESTSAYKVEAKYSNTVTELPVVTASISPEIMTPTNIDSNKQFVFGGIPAYAFEGAVNGVLTSDEKLQSYVTDVKVKTVKFIADVNGLKKTIELETGNPSNVSLITSSADTVTQRFASKTSGGTLAKGTAYSNDLDFTVPYFDGILFGTGSTIANVQMIVTLSYGTLECDVSRYITIQRKAEADELFERTVIADLSAPKKNNSSKLTSDHVGNILNDTLAVKLAPGADINLVVGNNHNKDFSGQTWTNLTNNYAYEITKYVSITQSLANLKQNLCKDAEFSVAVVDNNSAEEKSEFVVKYGATELLDNSTVATTITNTDGAGKPAYYANSTISVYADNIMLHINHVNELNSNNEKTERLYFLFSRADGSVGNGKDLYQHTQSFSVVPLYTKAQHSSETDNYFEVENYWKVSDGTSSYYVIGADQWGEKINLTNEKTTVTSKTLADESKYKFHYEIDTSATGGGSAIIDENGMITTAKDFAIADQTIFVNIYMKASGSNGMFEESNTKLRIARLRIALKSGVATSVKTTEGVYTTVSSADIIVVPTGYTLSSVTVGTTPDVLSVELDNTETGAVAYQLGTTLTRSDFEKMFANDDDLKGNYNRNYHIVAETLEGDTTNYQLYSRINTYNLTKTGTHTIDVVATYVNAAGTRDYKAFKQSIVVYDTSVTEEWMKFGKTDESISLDDKWTWYQIDATNGTIAEVVSKAYSNSNAGVYEVSYIAKSTEGSNTKFVNATYLICESEVQKNVAIQTMTEFGLSNIVEKSDCDDGNKDNGTETLKDIKVFEVSGDTAELKGSVMFNNEAGTAIEEKQYVVVGTLVRTAENGGTTTTTNGFIKLYKVNFIMLPTKTTEIGMIVENTQGDADKEALFDKVTAKLTEKTSLTYKANDELYEIGSNGILTQVSAIEVDGSDVEKNYLWAHHVSGTTYTYHHFIFNFYGYTDLETNDTTEPEVDNIDEINFGAGEATKVFTLSSMNDAVSDFVESQGYEVDSTKTISYSQMNEAGAEMQKISTISLEDGSATEIFYVQIGILETKKDGDGNDVEGEDGNPIKIQKDLCLYVRFNISVAAS